MFELPKWLSKEYICVGLGIIILLLMARRGRLIEGFNPVDLKDRPAEIEKENTRVLDSLNVSKYRANYEDTIQNKIKWCDNQILAHIVSDKLDVNDPMTEKNISLIQNINHLHQFKNILKESLQYLDKQ
tara:strand:- start:264 stop:650 length:387 start_codon:yes stop_codon:yes gene_type:complete